MLLLANKPYTHREEGNTFLSASLKFIKKYYLSSKIPLSFFKTPSSMPALCCTTFDQPPAPVSLLSVLLVVILLMVVQPQDAEPKVSSPAPAKDVALDLKEDRFLSSVVSQSSVDLRVFAARSMKY